MKKLSLILLALLTLTLVAPLVYGEEVYWYSQTHLGTGGSYSQNMMVGDKTTISAEYADWYAKGVQAWCSSNGGTCNFKAALVSYDTKTIIQLSDPVSVSTAAWYNFTFEGNYQVSAVAYYVCLISDSGTGWWVASQSGIGDTYLLDLTNSYTSPLDPSDGLEHGDTFYAISLVLNGTDPDPTPTPTPTPEGYTPPPDEATALYGDIVWYLVALIVVLLPAGILGVAFKFGAWGFITGLAIGSGLGYMLMPDIVPIWLTFAVIIGIVGMLMAGHGPQGEV